MVQAEQSVIGCLMMAPELLDRARAVLSPAMFEAQPLARIFSCMLELKKAGTPVDAVTVVSRLGDGYAAMIRECACIAPRIGTFPQYAAIVLDAWRERTLVTELQSLAISGRTADEMTAELERMAARQRSIMQKVHSASEQTFGEAVAQAYRDLLKPDTSLKTDWKHFNDVLGGLQRGCLYIIAARPGDGKTDFALHLAVQLAKRCRVDYRSLEMTKEQLVHRVLSRVCMINSTRFRDHDLDENAQKRIGIAAARMGDLHLVMDDTPGVSAGDVEAKLASGKPDVMFIDYLGLMRGDAAGNKPLWQITGEITHALKESARRHGAAVVALVVGTALASYRYAVTSQPEQQFEVVTAFGQKSSVTLPDGTRIWLNSGSRVSYSSAFNSRSRTVDLEGEAYFSVARNEKLPFVVQADGMAVTALGTKFNVKAYANEEEVVATLVEGKIRTDAGGCSEVLLPENQACYNRASGAMSVRAVDNMELPMAWFNNKIVFSGETLEIIARTLERMYNVKVVFGDDACRRYAYRGLVHNNSLHNVLYLISSPSPVDYLITGNTVEFRSRQP